MIFCPNCRRRSRVTAPRCRSAPVEITVVAFYFEADCDDCDLDVGDGSFALLVEELLPFAAARSSVATAIA